MGIQAILQYVGNMLLASSVWQWLTVTVVLIYFNWKRKPHPKFPPGPKGLPFFGVVPFLSSAPAKDFKKWSLDKYGPIMSVRFGMDDVVVLNTFESIHQALVKTGNAISDRPYIELFGYSKEHGIVFKPYGDDFKTQKHFALKYFREKGLGKMEMERIINDEGDFFVSRLLKETGKPLKIKEYFFGMAANVITQLTFGKRFAYDDPDFCKVLEWTNLAFTHPKHVFNWNLLLVWGFLSKIYPFSESQRYQHELAKNIADSMEIYIDELRKTFDPNNIGSFVEAFLYEQKHKKQSNKQGFSDIQLRIICRDFVVAGSDTTSTSLAWLLVYLLNFPKYKDQMLKEVDDVLGQSTLPSMSHRPNMPITCAFIQEVMRIRTISPLAVAHLTTTEVKLDQYVLPKGTKVFPNLYGSQMDPQTWPNPEHFNPNRHIDENGKFVASNKIIPFSIGSRFCLGESLARVEIFIIFVKILQKFHVCSGTDHLPPMDNEIVSAVISPRECVVKLQARN